MTTYHASGTTCVHEPRSGHQTGPDDLIVLRSMRVGDDRA